MNPIPVPFPLALLAAIALFPAVLVAACLFAAAGGRRDTAAEG